MKGLLLDWDGTLVDSKRAHEKAFRETLQNNCPNLLEIFDYEEHRGRPTKEVFESLGLKPSPQFNFIVSEKQRLYREAVSLGEVTLFPRAEELLRSCRQREIYVGVVTGSSRVAVRLVLDRLGLNSLLDDLVAAEDVGRGKPNPEGYLIGLTRSGLPAEEVVAIEDSVDGVEAALAAGLRCFGVHQEAVKSRVERWSRLIGPELVFPEDSGE